MVNTRIQFVNESTVLTDDEVKAAVSDLQTQVSRDFAPEYGRDAELSFASSEEHPSGAWRIVVLDDSDQAGALGYHDLTIEGLPIGKVFAGTDKKFGLQWTVTASHELLEMLGDPDINLSAFVPSQSGFGGTMYAYEVGDACEADEFGYKINDTLVSDFVYRAWFEHFRKPGSTRFDHGGHINAPFELLTGGYIGVYNVLFGYGWTQLTAARSPSTYDMVPRVGSRRERRGRPREQWLVSNTAEEQSEAIRS
jgi:hypothetical protein